MTLPTQLQEAFQSTGLPEVALKTITDKVEEYLSLVSESNKLVAAVHAAKAQDPNNVDYLDTLWRANELDEKISETVQRFDAVAEEYERLLKELREAAKTNFVPEALSEEQTQNARKRVNDMAPAIATARQAIAAQLTIPESVLQLSGATIPEGGLITFLPNAESLKNARGRKAATASGEVRSYATRVGEILIDGNSTNVDGKGKLAYAANALSEKFNASQVAANKVTAEEIEEAYFASLPGNIPFRGLKSTELPDEHTFTFEKNVMVQNKNDDSFTEVPQKVSITVRSTNYGENVSTEEPKTEDKPAAKSDETSETSANKPAAKKAATPAKK